MLKENDDNPMEKIRKKAKEKNIVILTYLCKNFDKVNQFQEDKISIIKAKGVARGSIG